MGKTKIEWARYSCNPIRARDPETGAVGWHCTKVTRACDGCYAEAFNMRAGTKLPYADDSRAESFLDERMLAVARKWPPGRIFWLSMTDLFGKFVKPEWRDAIASTWEAMPAHHHLVLTKRPGVMRKFMRNRYGAAPPANVWCGVSVAEPKDLRFLDILAATPAAVRWVSVEPYLEHIDFSDYSWLDWIVIGGESSSPGHRARPMPIASVRRAVGFARAAAIAVFIKQMSQADNGRDFKKFEAFPPDLQIREFPA